ncbi:MAG TPA: hypothetical protein VJH92_04470 [Candidatus Nanoarchaeia archaeon]|nr:hypothetical protein [Candidatus Nanoarchaeia archaeon]
MDNRDEIKLKLSGKVLAAVIITAIVIFLLTFAIFKYLPDQKRASEVNSYKKQIFDSVVCQYSCPLKEQAIQNKTQLLPDQTCVQQCAGDLNTAKEESAKFSDNDLKTDTLYSDIEALVASCRTSSVDSSGTIPKLDNVKFFDCVKQGLEGLKTNYSYLI